MKKLEEKITSRMADSVEQLGKIIKEYAKKNRRTVERVGDLEMKVFGAILAKGKDKKRGNKENQDASQMSQLQNKKLKSSVEKFSKSPQIKQKTRKS